MRLIYKNESNLADAGFGSTADFTGAGRTRRRRRAQTVRSSMDLRSSLLSEHIESVLPCILLLALFLH